MDGCTVIQGVLGQGEKVGKVELLCLAWLYRSRVGCQDFWVSAGEGKDRKA